MEKENKTSLSKEILDFVKVFAISAVIVLLLRTLLPTQSL